jgi:hypothetical protein
MLERSGNGAHTVRMAKAPKRPRDTNQLAHMVALLATGELQDVKTEDGKDPAAVALGRKGGLKGGPARAKKLSAVQRSKIAKVAATKRWKAVTAVD